MISAGRKKHGVSFRRQTEVDDGHGNTVASFAVISGLSSISAAFRPVFGRESVEAGRLESTLRGTLSVSRSAAVAAVLASDQVLFVRGPYTGKAFQIRSEPVTSDDLAHVEFDIESGVAQ